jgi:hypothetical protein
MTLRSMLVALLGLGLLGAPAFAAQQAGLGTVNYVEGAVYLEGAQLNAKDVGNANLDAGQVLTTGKGKAEILLTPGVFLRLDDNSAVKMISPDLTLTQIELEKGRAGIEVDQIHNQNNLQVIDAGVTTRLQKTGYYEFDANNPTAMVFKGKASVEVADGKTREIKGHHELMLAAANRQLTANEKTRDFDAEKSQDRLYNWSSLRSQYLAESNNQIAEEYGGAGVNPGWFWDPYSYGYTYIGMGPFASPFGWGFYPFGWGGLYGGFYGGGYYGRGYYGGHYGHGVGGYAGGGSGMGGGGFHGGGGHR